MYFIAILNSLLCPDCQCVIFDLLGVTIKFTPINLF